jgi:aminopeptidase N
VNLTLSEAAQRAALIANPAYLIELDLAGDAPLFGSRTTIRFESRQVGADTFVDLVAGEVISVTLNGRVLALSQVVGDDRITLSSLDADNTLIVEARCAYSHTGEGLHRFKDPVDGETYLYTQFEPADACRVFAVFEQPDIKGTYEFHVTAPTGWRVLSNQPLAAPPTPVAELPGRQSVTHRFEPTLRLSSYLTAIAAGPYEEWRDEVVSTAGRAVPLGLYARRSLAPHLDPDQIFDITKRGFGFYEPAFACPFPFAKYDQVFCPEYNFGAMENAGLVTITENYVFRSKPVEAMVERRAVTILHELAHMWFGDLVTMRWWDDLWLNESFAEFISHLAVAEATRWKGAWATFAWSEKLWAYHQDQLPTTHPVLARIDSVADVHNNFDGITYAKGASVLRQLVAWVGQDAFLAGLRSYFAKHAWGNTRLADLLAELATASGRDLDTWAEQWLRTTGVNTVAAVSAAPAHGPDRSLPAAPATTQPSWPASAQADPDPASGTGADVIVAGLAQTGTSEPTWRAQRIGLGGYNLGDGPLTRAWHKEVDLAGALTPLPRLAPADLVLVNDRDLAYAKARLDERSLATAAANVGLIDDPLARAVVWGVLWDMTRDAELGARVFADHLLRWVAHETISTGMQKLLAQLGVALESYTAPEFRVAASERAAERLWELAVEAAPGGDTQLQLVRAYARHATAPSQLDRLDELARGSRSLTGLTLDVDLSWDLLAGLVAAGRAGEERIDEQLAKDRTNAGFERAAGLRAALPEPEAKAAAWLRAVEDPATPNATQRAIVAGWGRVKDAALLVPFVEPYFAALPRIWRTRTPQIAATVAGGMYPSAVADLPGQDVLGATDAFLAELGEDLPPLRRLVTEGRAGVVRALAAQAADRTAGEPIALA